jgi:hypothetical protein
VDQRTRDYLIRAHNKVIAHYQKVLQASSLTHAERENIRRRMAGVEAELETISRRGASNPMQFLEAA